MIGTNKKESHLLSKTFPEPNWWLMAEIAVHTALLFDPRHYLILINGPSWVQNYKHHWLLSVNKQQCATFWSFRPQNCLKNDRAVTLLHSCVSVLSFVVVCVTYWELRVEDSAFIAFLFFFPPTFLGLWFTEISSDLLFSVFLFTLNLVCCSGVTVAWKCTFALW